LKFSNSAPLVQKINSQLRPTPPNSSDQALLVITTAPALLDLGRFRLTTPASFLTLSSKKSQPGYSGTRCCRKKSFNHCSEGILVRDKARVWR
ncbi:8190_t:CDS:2, partial [Ambispora gerdemannii]